MVYSGGSDIDGGGDCDDDGGGGDVDVGGSRDNDVGGLRWILTLSISVYVSLQESCLNDNEGILWLRTIVSFYGHIIIKLKIETQLSATEYTE